MAVDDSPVAIITGGASGIGLAAVHHLLNEGWNVTIVDLRSNPELQHLDPQKTEFVEGNVARYQDQVHAFSKTYQRWGKINLGTGIADRVDFFRPAPDDEYGAPPQPDTTVLDVDLHGVIWSLYLALHYFRKNLTKSGQLVITASSAGIYSPSELPLYCSAKHGVVGLCRSMAKRLQEGKEPITVNAICPGMVPTAILSVEMIKSFPREMVTQMSTVMKAFAQLVADPTCTGQILECSGIDIAAIPEPKYLNEASEFTSGGQYKSIAALGNMIEFSEKKGVALDESLAIRSDLK